MNDNNLLFTPDDTQRIEQVGAEYAVYLQKLQPSFERYVAHEQRGLEHIVSMVENYYFFLSFVGDSKTLNDTHIGVKGLAAKATTDVASIYWCMKSGYPLQSRTILRSLFETAVTVKFIYKDFDTRIRWYYDFKDFARYHKMKNSPESIPKADHTYLEKRYKEIRNRYNEHGDWYYNILMELKQTNPIIKRPNLRGLATAADMSDDYDKMYETLSLATHASPVIDHLFIHKAENFTMGPRFDRELAKTGTAFTVNFAHLIFEQILSQIGTDRTRSLVQYSMMLNYTTMKSCKELSMH